jgi:hypothetical protein
MMRKKSGPAISNSPWAGVESGALYCVSNTLGKGGHCVRYFCYITLRIDCIIHTLVYCGADEGECAGTMCYGL